MADYYPLIARAVAGLEKNTGEARRALYERARTALLAQLRGVEPALEETEITRERLGLEEAIRKVEAEAARRARLEPASIPTPSSPTPSSAATSAKPALATPAEHAAPSPARPPATPAAPTRPAAANGAPRPAAPAAGAQQRPPIRPAAAAAPSGRPSQPAVPAAQQASGGAATPRSPMPPVAPSRSEGSRGTRPAISMPQNRPAQVNDPFAELAANHGIDRLEPEYADRTEPGQSNGHSAAAPDEGLPPPRRVAAPRRATQDPLQPRRSYAGLIKGVIVILLLLGLAGLGYWQRDAVVALYKDFTGPKATQTASETPAQRPKITDRIGQDNGIQAGPAVAQRVVLYEEEPNDPQGKRYVGSAIWRTETVSPGSGQPPELAVRADVEIPERKMTMKLSLRRNTDQALPASHTIEIMFNLPPDFSGGTIANVPGILMKQAEQTRGTPLSGLAVKVTTGFFLIGLSAVEADVQRNIQLLKERAWFDIPVVYSNNRRAILAIEKGTPGEKAFAEAFAAWKQ